MTALSQQETKQQFFVKKWWNGQPQSTQKGESFMTDQTILTAISKATGLEIPDFSNRKTAAKILALDFVYAAVGLFILDVSWRIMDLMIDFICAHVHWLAWLGD